MPKAITRKPTVKPAAKESAAQKAAAVASKKPGVFRWLFTPDMPQGWRGWIMRSFLFVMGFGAFILAFGAIGLQMKFLEIGAAAPSLWTAAGMIAKSMLQVPGQVVLGGAIVFLFGMFLFMPRKFLDKTSFLATSLTFFFWTMLLSGAIMQFAKSEALAQDARFLLLFLYLAMVCAMTGAFAGVVCYARKIGVSKTALFLSFPFGCGLYEYAAEFLPSKDKEQVLDIKYNWYRRLIDFLLNTRNGQIILAGMAVALVAFMPYPSEVFMIVMFSGLYFWKGKEWLAGKVVKLSWIAAIANLAMIAYGIYFIDALSQTIMAM